MKKSLIFTLTLLLFKSILAQTPQLIKEQGDRYFANEQYFKAIEFYKSALVSNPDMTSAKYEMANAYRLTFDYESAEAYYEEVLKSSASEQVYPLARYYYGVMKKLNGDLQGAILELDKTVAAMKENNYAEDERYRKYYLQAKIEKEGCQFALNELSNPKINRNFRGLDEPVNTEFNDFAPYTFINDSSIVISSARTGGTGNFIDNRFGESFSDLFRFSKESGSWEETKDGDRFSRMLNSKWGDGSGSFNASRDKYYFTNCNAEEQQGCFIFVSTLEDGRWSEPVALNQNVNQRGYNSKHPSLSPGGDTLFFISDNPEGFGQFDIWYSTSISGDNWGQAKNMGNHVNTAFNEISPFYDGEQSALFFASDGHRGFGGLDIFMAKGKSFEKPEVFNLGAPYNSNQDECFFVLGEKTGYISSNRDGGKGRFDIYAFDIETEEEVISEIAVEEAIAGRNSMFSDDYDFDTPETGMVEEIISQLIAAQMAGVDAILNSEDQLFYENLSQDDKDRIDRIVKARFRNMAQSEMRALRVEDEFYYSNLGYEEREVIDQMIISRIEQKDLSLSVRYDNIASQFYHGLPKEEKEKVDQFIAFKIKEAESKTLTPEVFNSLEPSQKREVINIVAKYFKEKKNLDQLSLNPTSLMFVRSMDDNTEAKFNVSIREKLANLSNESGYELTDQDKIFYQNLDSEQMSKLENIATAFLTADVNKFSSNISRFDLAFYQQLNNAQQQSADRVLAKMINNMITSDLYYADAHLERENIASLSKKRLDAENISEVMASLTPTEKQSLNQISQDNLKRIDRFLVATSGQFLEKKIDGFFPEKTSEPVALASNQNAQNNTQTSSTATTSTNNQTSDAKSQTTSENQQTTAIADNSEQTDKESKIEDIEPIEYTTQSEVTELSIADAEYYDEKEDNEKLVIDRIIAASYLNDIGNATTVQTQAYEVYKDLPADQKDYVKLLARKVSGEDIDPLLIVPALNFYNSSAESVKEKWNKMVYSRALETNNGKFQAKREDYLAYNGLSDEEKAIVDRIKNHRLTNKRLIPDIQVIEAKDLPDRQVIQNLVSYNTGQYEYIYISGQLTDEVSGKPMANFPLAIRKKNGELAYQTYTDNQGKFEFENIKSDNYDIVSGKLEDASLADRGFFVRSLNVRGANENLYSRSVSTKLYFDSGADKLRDEVVVTLDEIVDVFKSNTDMIIELHGHTDNVGSEQLNLSLSKERSEMVFQYLVDKGVPSNKIVINFYGLSKPVSENTNAFGRQFNRRVDVRLLDDELIKYQPASIYLVRPKGTLYSIAKNFGVSVEDIKKWNGIDGDEMIQAYKPLRIVNPKGLKPNLDMLVELNQSVETGYREYTVMSGETLQSISTKFNIPEELLLEINELEKGVRLRPGQKLKIYVSY